MVVRRRLKQHDFLPYKLFHNYKMFYGEVQYDSITSTRRHLDDILCDYFPDKNDGVMLDVGAFDPIVISNSFYFEQKGWTCYCFEANPTNVERLKAHRKNVFQYAISDCNIPQVDFTVVSCGRPDWTASYSAIELSDEYKQVFGWDSSFGISTIQVEQKTLNSILEENNITHIDAISMDIEGGELKALHGIDLNKYTPKVILVENAMPTRGDIEEYLKTFGYLLHRQLDYNQIYVHQQEA